MVKAQDFQALQMLVVAISQHLALTSPQFRPLIAAVTQALEKGIALPGMDPVLADHHSAEFFDSWQWLIARALAR